jgi:hypothetical protein
MTVVWFVVWLAADLIGGHAPLRFDPVNAWAATLILAVALDVNRHAATSRRG